MQKLRNPIFLLCISIFCFSVVTLIEPLQSIDGVHLKGTSSEILASFENFEQCGRDPRFATGMASCGLVRNIWFDVLLWGLTLLVIGILSNFGLKLTSKRQFGFVYIAMLLPFLVTTYWAMRTDGEAVIGFYLFPIGAFGAWILVVIWYSLTSMFLRRIGFRENDT